MRYSVLRLKPQGAFYFGIRGIGLEASATSFASDRLYAALFVENLRTRVFPEWIADPHTLPFRISSCFPYVGTVQLFPRPLLGPLPSQQTEPQPGERKPLKKVQLVSTAVLQHLLAGGNLREYVIGAKGRLLQGGSIVIDAAEDGSAAAEKGLWKVERVPHVTVDRVTNQPTYYETAQVWFNQDCGLSLLASGDVERLEQLLQLLGDSGIGGRRSKGVGLFAVEKGEPLELPDPGTSHVLLLSSYAPAPAELPAVLHDDQPIANNLKVSYALEDIGGWSGSLNPAQNAQRRKVIRMINAGSVIRSPGTKMLGHTVDVRPQGGDSAFAHPVWRHGQALAIGIVRDARSFQ